MSIKFATTIVLSALLGYCLGIDTGDSDRDVTLLAFLGLVFGMPCFTIGWLTWRQFYPGRVPLRRYLLRLPIILVVAFFAAAIGWWRVHPSGIRYRFADGTGASGTWREVQIEHLEAGTWLEGPWVGAWPMKVRFPDIDGDGYPDIEISGQEGRVVFLYLPKNDGLRFWHLAEKSGAYAASYRPDNVIYP